MTTETCPTSEMPMLDARSVPPRLAVLIPVYNNPEGCSRALASLAADSSKPFDVFVVDDGSKRRAEVPDGLPFRTELLLLNPNRRIAGALNHGLDAIYAADYEYVARLDADDQSLPGRFGRQLDFLDRHADHAIVGMQAELVRPDGTSIGSTRRPLRDPDIRRFMRYRNPLVHPTVMMRVEAVREVGGYRTLFPSSEDFDLWFRLSQRYRLANLAEIGVLKEMGPERITANRASAAASRVACLRHHWRLTSGHAWLGLAQSSLVSLALSSMGRAQDQKQQRALLNL